MANLIIYNDTEEYFKRIHDIQCEIRGSYKNEDLQMKLNRFSHNQKDRAQEKDSIGIESDDDYNEELSDNLLHFIDVVAIVQDVRF